MVDAAKLTSLAIAYDAGDAHRVQHLPKVYALSRATPAKRRPRACSKPRPAVHF